MAFEKATRSRVRLRALFDGISGSGKTILSLILANAISKEFGGRIAVVDTQGGQSLAYADAPLPNGDLADFDIKEINTGNPNAYISAINEAESSKDPRYSVVIVDSLSQAWVGKDGILEQKDKAEGKGPQPWATVSPLQNRFTEKLTTCKLHMICTVRVKTETVWEKNAEGKVEGYKVGLKAVQKEGLEYEFDLVGSIDQSHTLRIQNCRGIQALDRAIIPMPNEELTGPVLEWLKTGRSTIPEGERALLAPPGMVNELVQLVTARFGTSRTVQEQKFWEKYGVEMVDAPHDQIAEALAKIKKVT